jgi:hypothetical protein
MEAHRSMLAARQPRERSSRAPALAIALTVLAAILVLGVSLVQPGVTIAAGAGTWTQYAHDPQRTSVDPDQPPISQINLDWTVPVDGAVFAQPLVWNGRVYVATENNSIYAFDATTHATAWQRLSIASPALDGDLVSGGAHCSNLGPTVGITSTPVIDPSTGRLYAVAQVRSSSLMSTLHYELLTLDANTGTTLSTKVIDPWFRGGLGDHTSAETAVEQQRGALLLANNTIYVPFGGRVLGCGTWYGWMASISTTTGSENTFQIPAQPKGGSIWSPGGPSLDASGNVWATSGNASCPGGCQSSQIDLTESVIKFSPGLGVLDSFTPSNWVELNNDDLDIGSFTTAHLGNDLAFQTGKSGQGFLLRESNLGHSSSTGQTGAQISTQQVCNINNPFAHAAAAWVPPNLYLPCQERVKRIQITAGASPSFTIAAMGPSNSYTGSTVFSGGIVWNVNPTFDSNGNVVSGTLNSYNAQTLTTLFPPITLQLTSGQLLKPAHFASPASGNNHLYVATDGQLSAYKLSSSTPPTNTPTPTATSTPNPNSTSTPTPQPTVAPATPTSTATPTGNTNTFTLNPVADTYISSSAPNSTAGGTSTELRSDAVHTDTAFLRFDLSALAGKTITSATLRLHTTGESWAGSTITHNIHYVAASDWSEQYMSFNNSIGPNSIASSAMATLTGTAPNTWYTSSALSQSIVQARAGQLLSMSIDAPTGDVLVFYSRESGTATAPQLIVTTR